MTKEEIIAEAESHANDYPGSTYMGIPLTEEWGAKALMGLVCILMRREAIHAKYGEERRRLLSEARAAIGKED